MEKNVTEEVRTLGALLRLPYEHLQRRIYEALAERGFADIRPAHSAVFRHILPAGSRLTDLAERAQMTKQSMAYLVNALHELGYLEMAPDPSDGRARLVCLTERGREFQGQLVMLSLQVEQDLGQALGQPAVAQLRELLEALVGHLESPPPQP